MFYFLLRIHSWPYKIGDKGIVGVKYSENLGFFFKHVLVLFDGCMIVHLLFSHVLGNVTGFVYMCIGFIWWMHDCPPVVLVLFDGCMIVHLLFSHVFVNVTGFVYVWKLSWCMLVLVHRLVLMALFSFFPDNSTKLTFSLWATQNDLMYWFCMVCFTETFNLSHKKEKKKT